MLKEIETEYGTLSFDENIIYEMVYDAVDRFGDKVSLGNANSRFQLRNNEDSFIDVYYEEDVLHVDIYVIVGFGTSISSVTNDILTYVKLSIIEAFGEIRNQVRVVVTGVQTKQNIAKRYIEEVL